tara:strand:+ start:52 stop:573 length:522 start_codon:yes stop_codon:yes gene_type:complete
MRKLRESKLILQPWMVYSQNIASLNTSDRNKDLILEIVKTAFTYKGVEYKYIESRRREIVDAKIIVCKVLYEFFKLSFAGIGSVFNKNHATVIHYIKMYNNTLIHNKEDVVLFNRLCDNAITGIYGDKVDLELSLSTAELEKLNNTQLRRLIKEITIENNSLKSKLEKIKSYA